MVCEVGKMKCYPIKFEAIDSHGDLLFTVTAVDESTANIDVKTLVNVEVWKEISAEIEQCLIKMELS